ncbi:Copper-exporting P-type ATPase [Azospirillaceae bacterium]
MSSDQATATLAVSGMTCAACVNRLERILTRKPGVMSATISLPAERAEIHFDPDRIDLVGLVAVVEGAGFKAQPIDENAKGAAGSAAHDAEARETRRVLLISAVLSLPLLAGMAPMALPEAGLGWMTAPGWAQWLLATPIQFWVGRRFYRGAWNALKSGGANMDVLVALGTSAAWLLSTWQVINGWSSEWEAGTGHGAGHGPIHYSFEASALVITFVMTGKWLETRARRATGQAIEALLALRPETARVVSADGPERLVPVERVQVKDVVRVRPGERIPVDGRVIEGRASVDEAMVTGEAMPQDRGPGDIVTGGSMNLDGVLTLVATAVGTEATLGRMIALVGHAQATRPRIQRLADIISGYFAFFVAAAALATLLGWSLTVGGGERAVLAAVSVLVVACPCALGLATPAVIAAALGVAARCGLLIRDAEALETAYKIDAVVFDKTGTLTEDRPQLTDVVVVGAAKNVATEPLPTDPLSPSGRLLRLATAAQRGSTHPIARAMSDSIKDREWSLPEARDYRTLAGRGVRGVVNNDQGTSEDLTVLLGNLALMTEYGVDVSALTAQAAAFEAEGKAVVWVAGAKSNTLENGEKWRLLGALAASDRIRSGAATAIKDLSAMRIQTVMLTGDAPAAAQATAEKVGVGRVIAGAKPENKIIEIKRLQLEGRTVAMIGDGINDAPALAQADLGVAMSGGMDAAAQAAGVVLMRGEPLLVVTLVRLARATRRKILQNLVWAFGFNIVMIPMAALGQLDPALAALGMTISSLAVVGNALLLQKSKTYLLKKGS